MTGMNQRTLARFKQMWAEGMQLHEIACLLRYKESTLSKLRIAYGLPPRGTGGRPGRREYIPTPAEIRAAAARERENWTPQQWMAARVGPGHTVYDTIQRYTDGTE